MYILYVLGGGILGEGTGCLEEDVGLCIDVGAFGKKACFVSILVLASPPFPGVHVRAGAIEYYLWIASGEQRDRRAAVERISAPGDSGACGR